MELINKKLNLAVCFYFLLFVICLYSLSLFLNNHFILTISFFTVAFITVCFFAFRTTTPLLSYLLGLTTMVKTFFTYFLYISGNSIFPDSAEYIKLAEDMKSINLFSFTEMVHYAGTTQVTYYSLNGFIFNFFQNEFALYLINILLFNITVILLYKTLIKDFNKKISLWTCLLLIVSANTFVFTSLILKDSLVLFLTILSIYIYKNKIDKRDGILNTVILFIVLLVLFMTRIYAGASILLAIIIELVFIKKVKHKWFILFIFTIFLSAFLLSSIGSVYVALIINYFSNVSIITIIPVLILAIMKFFFSPLPWNFFNEDISVYTYLILDSWVIILSSVVIFPYLFRVIANKLLIKKYTFYFVPIIIHAIALGIAYDGDSTRQRIAIYWIVILFMVNAIYYTFNKQKERVIK